MLVNKADGIPRLMGDSTKETGVVKEKLQTIKYLYEPVNAT
ncbi:hypothetical protein [Atopobium sp. oral taxon 810]|nr:hypothetical protein [Atopobium sp. oral taxon 810]ERI05482.1 hypothetical protein HMPREF9069_00800 [Atopobium sp. oral taxon 810 str. F0209]